MGFKDETYQAIWDVYPDGVVIVNYMGIIVLVNQKACKMFDYEMDKMIGTPIANLLPGGYIKSHIKKLENYLNEFDPKAQTGYDSTTGRVLKGAKKNGEEFFAKVDLSPLKIDQKNLVATFIKDVDIRESLELRYHKMVGEVEDYSMVFLDPNGIIRNWNKGVERIIGYKEHDIVGKNFSMFFSSEEIMQSKPQMLLTQAIENGKAEDEGWRTKKDGSLYWASVTISTILDDSGYILGFSKVTRDLTEKMRAEKLLKQQSEELKIKNKELQNFTYVASHDLQEPLSTVTSMIELIREEEGITFTSEVDEYFTYIEDSVDRMRKLIRSLLEYSRLGKNKNLVFTNMNEIVSEVQEDLSLRIRNKSAVIEVGKMPSIMAYDVELRLLIQNLIGNALKFSSPDRPPIISIQAEEFENHWQFVVSDNGIGIQDKYLDKIFVMFQRLNKKWMYEGDGIGLSHSKKIVEIHDGTIWADSEYGEGTKFTFTISKRLKNNSKEVDEQINVLEEH